MKYMKKFMALLAVLTLALTMAVPAFAETTTPTKYTITINNGTGNYAAYQIFKGDLHEKRCPTLSGAIMLQMRVGRSLVMQPTRRRQSQQKQMPKLLRLKLQSI